MTKPPPALHGALVIEFAIADETVDYEERQTLFVAGKPLGRVPQPAICQGLEGSQIWVLHCDQDWEVVANGGAYKSVAEAKSKLELSYHGIETKWVSTGYKREDGTRYLERLFENDSCMFCGRNPLQVEAMIVAGGGRICDHCVDEFYDQMHREPNEN